MQNLDLFFKRTASGKTSSQTSSSHENPSSSKAVTNNLDELLSISECVLNAGVYWVLKVVEARFSYRSCTDSSLLKVVFRENNEIAQKFSSSRTKCSYIISYSFAQFLKENLISTINLSPYFTLSFDKKYEREYQEPII